MLLPILQVLIIDSVPGNRKQLAPKTPADGSFVFRGFVSPNGNNWKQIRMEIHKPMGAHALAGMAVTAHTDPPNDHLQDGFL
jgi:hypothetical protein